MHSDRSAPAAETVHERTALVRAAIGACGISAVGIAGADVDAQTHARLSASVARGDLESWKYDAAWAARAADPRTIFARARSVVSFAVPYAHAAPRRAKLTGRISNYAWSDADYHDVLRSRGAHLIAAIEGICGPHDAVVVCDTKPIAERAAAARAGLGWIGKHTNLIVPVAGSFVFLAEILTTAELVPDAPRATHCGSCRRCIDVCPTGALRGDYTMDARRCISDLTQRRGILPRAMRPLMGDWIWGCDLCQEICPPTRRARTPGDPAFAPRSSPFPDLLELLRIDTAEFSARFADGAMGWRGAALLRRNAAIALGNSLDRATVPGLIAQYDREGSSVVRAHIVWALQRIGSPAAQRALTAMQATEGDAAVLAEFGT